MLIDLDQGVVATAYKNPPGFTNVSKKLDGSHYSGKPQLSSLFDSMKRYVY